MIPSFFFALFGVFNKKFFFFLFDLLFFSFTLTTQQYMGGNDPIFLPGLLGDIKQIFRTRTLKLVTRDGAFFLDLNFIFISPSFFPVSAALNNLVPAETPDSSVIKVLSTLDRITNECCISLHCSSNSYMSAPRSQIRTHSTSDDFSPKLLPEFVHNCDSRSRLFALNDDL